MRFRKDYHFRSWVSGEWSTRSALIDAESIESAMLALGVIEFDVLKVAGQECLALQHETIVRIPQPGETACNN